MKIISHESAWESREFDPVSGELSIDTNPGSAEPADFAAVQGTFAYLGDHLVVFFRKGDALGIAVDRIVYTVDDSILITWRIVRESEYDSGSNLLRRGESELTISQTESVLIQLRYPSGPAEGPPLWEDPTPFISDEDWDLGLFISNVLSNEDRRRSIYRQGPRHDRSTPGSTDVRHEQPRPPVGVEHHARDVADALGDDARIVEAEFFSSGAIALTLRYGDAFAIIERNAAGDEWGASVNDDTPFLGHRHVGQTLRKVLEAIRPELPLTQSPGKKPSSWKPRDS